EIKEAYEVTVRYMIDYLKHDLHVGGKYYDAYPARNLPKYGVLKVLGDKQYELLAPYTTNAQTLITWIPKAIQQHIINFTFREVGIDNRPDKKTGRQHLNKTACSEQ
ncbi:MAG TPA: hypothetical protein VEC93_17425, partial [Anaerolineae bacterium]|nr:hypothetical protein [Anaerolineae bacterium]